MIILGIDPGLHICGYACMQALFPKEKLIEAGILKSNTNSPIEIRLNQIAGDIESLLTRFLPDIIAVEELYSHYAHPKTSILMGHARGVILQKCAQAGIKVKSFSATRIKKAITGNGRATKQQIQRSVQTILSLPKLPSPPDVADAVAVALCCANSMSKPAYIKGR